MAKFRTPLSHIVRRSLLLLIACMVFTATALLPASQTAYATPGGAIGGGGDPGGGAGGGWSTNGWGWFNYSVDGNPAAPAGFKNPPGGNWASVSQTCRNIGANRVIAFIFLNTYGSNGAHGVVYQYKSGNQPGGYDNLSQHRSTGDWLATPAAESMFNSPFLNPYRGGYTWGQNVAWFCYSATPPPPVDYSLTPVIENTSDGVVEPGSSVSLNPRVGNSGNASSIGTEWQLTSFLLSPGSAIPGQDLSSQPPCQFFQKPGVTDCRPAVFTNGDSNTGNYSFLPKYVHYYTQRPATIGDLAAGTRVCYALSVQPRANDDSRWYHSNPTCVTVGKKPKTQIWGGDLISANYVNTGTSPKDISGTTHTFGSWVEYGIFAAKTITGAASGSAYAGTGLEEAPVCTESQLSFTNAGCKDKKDKKDIGNYANSPSIPDVGASFPTSALTFKSSDNLSAVQSGVYRVDGDELSLGGGNIQKGGWVVINAPLATVTITEDIKYTEAQLSSVNDIPQVIIIANKIIINSKVTRVDAWLVASGTNGIIETCNVNSLSYKLTGTDRLTVNKCKDSLVVNGPVMAKQLWLRRTAGSGSGIASGEPAEVFNLRPDAYMWANLHASDNNRVQTVYSTELPPRL